MNAAAPLLAVGVVLLLAGQPLVQRPRILGLAHIGVFVSDMASARAFYEGLLGFPAVAPDQAADSRPQVVRLRINERQSIELIGRPNAGEGQLDHVALRVDDAGRMRAYLLAKGVEAGPVVAGGRAGGASFDFLDPDGHRIELVERDAEPHAAAGAGGVTPIADRALHAGILVGELARAERFYSGVLGFEEFWRGSGVASKTLSWVNMRVPEGEDYLEFMLYDQKPAPDRRGSAHHLCLLVPDAAKAAAVLESRRERSGYVRPIEVRTGVNRKRQVNLFDPDGTRIELMEPHTVDGIPAPSSTLPPPR